MNLLYVLFAIMCLCALGSHLLERHAKRNFYYGLDHGPPAIRQFEKHLKAAKDRGDEYVVKELTDQYKWFLNSTRWSTILAGATTTLLLTIVILYCTRYR